MIRFTFAAAFFVFVIVVLEIPSIYPAARFIEQIRIEHALCAQFWNESHAINALERMLDLDEVTAQVTPTAPVRNAARQNTVDTVAASEAALVSNRFIRNPYFRSISAMLTLVTYRIAVLIEWQPVLLTICIVLAADGFAVRVIKSKEFAQHNPQAYALFTCLTIVTICGAGIAFMLPYSESPLFAPALQLACAAFMHRAVSNYQRRG
jgi:hypothetical protein